MYDLKDNDEVYEVEFDELKEGEAKTIDVMQAIMNAKLDITVSIGSSNESIEKIASLDIGDIIVLDKHLEEDIDINVNGKVVASGESIILDNKIAIKLSKIKIEDENK